MVVVLDPTLLAVVDVTEGLAENGKLVVNTTMTAAELREKMKVEGRQLYTIDATGIALANIGKAIPNTPMIGALIKATGILDIEGVTDDFRQKFATKFREDIIEGNVNAINQAFNEVKGE